MGRNLAKLISYVTSAPLVAIYNMPIICLKEQNCLVASLIAFLFLTFFPVAPIINDARKGRTDIFVAQRGKRLKFFTLTIINHFVGFLLSLFFKLKVLPLYIIMLLYSNSDDFSDNFKMENKRAYCRSCRPP